MLNIGILALQGAFEEHKEMLDKLKVNSIFIRNIEDLKNIDGLIIPGGESTVIRKLLIDLKMDKLLKRLIVEDKIPVLATCAGLIVLSKSIDGVKNSTLGILDINVKRNAYGRQIDSFSEINEIKEIAFNGYRQVFIRAPYVDEVGDNISILSTYKNKIVAIEKDNILAMSFHPELTNDLRVHEYFLNKI